MTEVATVFAITGLGLAVRSLYLTIKHEWQTALQWSTLTTIAYILAYLTKP